MSLLLRGPGQERGPAGLGRPNSGSVGQRGDMDLGPIALALPELVAHAGEHAGGDIVEVLALLHYVIISNNTLLSVLSATKQ